MTQTNERVVVFWFRRDLRSHDNRGFYEALQSGYQVLPLFIFDKLILDKLPSKEDQRVQFIHDHVMELKAQFEEEGSTLLVEHGEPKEVFKKLFDNYKINGVYINRDYEPYARERDQQIQQLCKKNNVSFYDFKDQVIFEQSEVVKDDGDPYVVYTPYMKKWKEHLADHPIDYYPSEKNIKHLVDIKPSPELSLEDIGFQKTAYNCPPYDPEKKVLKSYGEERDYPAVDGTTKIGVHLRFGTVSIREMIVKGQKHSEKWFNELIWREFYHMILYHFPHSATEAFRSKYNHIPWRNNEEEFLAWCHGKTGYPIVDAGMRELNETGYMHNRIRMVVASFLTKHLLIDWRWGEAYFAEKLLDYDMANNVGGWQWAAGSGCDAAPYFRIFNPLSQTKKFDPQLQYIKKWVPELEDPFDYPKPIVDHKFARERALETYKKALNNAEE